MKCRNCGTEFDRRDGSCPWCGTAVLFGAKKSDAKPVKKVKEKDLWDTSDSWHKNSWNHAEDCGNDMHDNLKRQVVSEPKRTYARSHYESGVFSSNEVSSYNSKAIASLVCGIMCIWFNCGILNIIGIVLGSKAKKEIARTGERGLGLAKIGQMLSWIMLIFLILFVALFVIGLIVSVSDGNMFN